MFGGFTLQAQGLAVKEDSSRSLKLQSVLAYLILHKERPVSQAELIELFWAEDDSVNPTGALKTTFYRIRALLQPLLGDEIQPILSQRGAYRWNEQVSCIVDTAEFDKLCHKASNPSAPAETRIDYYRQALALYSGDLLPRLNEQLWVMSLSTHYHMRFLEVTKALCDLLEQLRRYEEMHEVSVRASALDRLDEGLHVRIIRALIGQNETAAALKHFDLATDLLYRGLKVRPSEELRALYDELMNIKKNASLDLDVITEDLRESAEREGAYLCPYGTFKELYRLEKRRTKRTQIDISLLLLTVLLQDGRSPMPSQLLSDAMNTIRATLSHILRSGDVVTQYSGMQYAVMLPECSLDSSQLVVDRIRLALQAESFPGIFRVAFDTEKL